jgi:hypothetical protein
MEVLQPESVMTEQTVITPKMAEMFLAKNQGNRKVRPRVIDQYARDIASRNWDLNGESVKIATDGTVIDGQHRLLACVQADAPFPTLIVRGLLISSRGTIDQGTRRSFGDVLKWHGVNGSPGLAAAIETALCWDESGTPAHHGRKHSYPEKLGWLEANPDIQAAVKSWTFAGAPHKFPCSTGAPFLMRARRIDLERAETFISLFKSGANMGENHPVMRLRTFCFNAASRKGKYPREEYAAVAVKSWNAFLVGREIRLLSWGRARGEDFPLMSTPDGRTYEEILTDPNYTPPGLATPPSTFVG